MAFKRITAATSEPITLDQAKDHCRVDLEFKDDDALISELIKTARDYVEKYTQRPLITQTWQLQRDCFSDVIQLKANLESVTQVRYLDGAGVLTVINPADYMVDYAEEIGVIYLVYGKAWPDARNIRNAVEVDFVAGYGLADDVPSSIKSAMLLLIGHWYQNRESVIVGVSVSDTPQAVDMLLAPYRVYFF